MGRAHSRILAAISIVALAMTGNSGAAGSGSGAAPAASAPVSTARGVWAGKAWISNWPFSPTVVEVPARGLVRADGSGLFLVRNTVASAQLPYSYVFGAPVIGTATDFWFSSGGRTKFVYTSRTVQQQSLDLRWCTVSTQYPDCLPRWDRMLLHYNRSYGSGSSLAKIAGHYVDTLGQYKGVLTIAGDGNVFMQDPATGCVVNGRVAMINRAYNMYSIKLAYANCRSATLKGASFSGLVTYDGSTRKLFALMLGTAADIPAANKLELRRQ